MYHTKLNKKLIILKHINLCFIYTIKSWFINLFFKNQSIIKNTHSRIRKNKKNINKNILYLVYLIAKLYNFYYKYFKKFIEININK